MPEQLTSPRTSCATSNHRPRVQRVVVTGATGGLGRRACELLLDCDIEVQALGRDVSKARSLVLKGAVFSQVDLTCADLGTLTRLFEGADAVWHCAALSSPWGSARAFQLANEVASQQVALASRLANVPRLVHVSTPAVYFDYRHRYDVTETQVADTFANHYARSKYVAEALVHSEVVASRGSLSAAILRPRALFGPGDQVLLPRLLQVARSHKGALRLPRGGRVVLDLTYLDNVVEAMWCATRAPLESSRVFNITNGEPVELAGALTRLFTLLKEGGMDEGWRVQDVPPALVDLAARGLELVAAVTRREPALTRYSAGVLNWNMTLDISRARRELGYTPQVSVAEGLERTARSLLAQHALRDAQDAV